MNIIIVDDNKSVCSAVKSYIEQYITDKCIDIAVSIFALESGEDLFEYIEKGNKADIIFMDIMLNKYNGIDIAAGVQKRNAAVKIVFITGYIEFATEIFTAKPLGFLVKPLSYDKISLVMDKIIREYREDERKFICVKSDGALCCIDISDIYYIEVQRKIVMICMKDAVYSVHETFSAVEQRVGGKMIKCHRSYMINPEKIKTMTRYQIELLNGKIVPVARSKSKEIYDKIYSEIEILGGG